MPTEAILSTVRQFLGVDPTVRISLEPIKRGAGVSFLAATFTHQVSIPGLFD